MLKVAFAVAVGIVVVLVVYSLTTTPGSAPIESVRAYLTGESSRPQPAATPSPSPTSTTKDDAAAKASAAKKVTRPGRAAASAPPAVAPAVASKPRVPTPTVLLPPVRVAPPPKKPVPVPPSHYLPGNTTAWTTFGIRVQGPTVVLARGVIATPADSSGPNGLSESNRERTPASAPEPGRNERALDSAPYLSLIGRICASGKCTPPFFIGTGAVLCPSELQMTGELQLWTNNYVREQGVDTVNPFRTVSGGFYLHGEAAPSNSCETASPSAGHHPAALAPGSVLRKPEFRISSSQTFWKPFFLPLDQPLIVRASGNIEVRGVKSPIGPNGIATPPNVDDPRSQLYATTLPYGALMGRLCRVEACDAPFVIGRERTICPREAGGRHLELWINHLITLPKPGDPNRPPTFHIFEWQGRSGEFTFEIEGARSGCS